MGVMDIINRLFYGKKQFVSYQERQRRKLGYWRSNSIYLDNIYNKIAIDVAMMKFKHVKIVKNAKGQDEWEVFEQSDLMNVVAYAPNLNETPVVFWSNVIRTILQKGYAVVVPTYKKQSIENLELATGDVKFGDSQVIVTVDGVEKVVNKADVWIFENPKQNLTTQLNQITGLIDDNLRSLSAKLNEESGSVIHGFLKLPTKAADGELKKKAEERVENITNVAENGGIGYLEKEEEFQQLTRSINTASTEELEFLKMQLYQAFGINEKLFTCDYSEMQFKAYFSGVLKVYQRVISEEINRKYFTKTARTQGQKLLVYFDLFDLTSLKDLTEFGYRMTYSAISNPNEIRELVGWLPYEGGDQYATNANAVPVS